MRDSAKIKLLEKRRGQLGMSNDEFAKHLGVDPGSWSKIRRGQRPLGWKLPMAVALKFPDLASFFLPK
jgi:transcriptional regulator with XRE-family HTH domain